MSYEGHMPSRVWLNRDADDEIQRTEFPDLAIMGDEPVVLGGRNMLITSCVAEPCEGDRESNAKRVRDCWNAMDEYGIADPEQFVRAAIGALREARETAKMNAKTGDRDARAAATADLEQINRALAHLNTETEQTE